MVAPCTPWASPQGCQAVPSGETNVGSKISEDTPKFKAQQLIQSNLKINIQAKPKVN